MAAKSTVINGCKKCCDKHVLSFYPKKSKVMVFSKAKIDYVICMRLIAPWLSSGSSVVDFVNVIKYIETTILIDKGLSFSAAEDLRNFYCSAISILNIHGIVLTKRYKCNCCTLIAPLSSHLQAQWKNLKPRIFTIATQPSMMQFEKFSRLTTGLFSNLIKTCSFGLYIFIPHNWLFVMIKDLGHIQRYWIELNLFSQSA